MRRIISAVKVAVTLTVTVSAAAALAGCGGGGKSPSVANLNSTASSTTAPPPAAGGPSHGPDLAKLTAYASCMRSHGVASFPDPQTGPNGGAGFKIQAGPGTGMDPNSTTFQNADKACKHLLPNGGIPPKMTPQEQQKWLQWAACIRSHGVPNFPDPDFSGGGIRIKNGGGGPTFDDKTFQTAQDECKSLSPGGAFSTAGG